MHTAQSDTQDEVLVAQTLASSREAYGLLVVRYSRSVRALCLARLGSGHDIDDLVQESFLRAFKGLRRLKEKARFGAYLHRIARNVCVDWLRRHRRDPASLEDQPVDLSVATDDPVDVREERMQTLRMLVGRLPLALREAVMLFYFDNRSYVQIAECLDISEAAVNQRLHRARVALRSAVGVTASEGGV